MYIESDFAAVAALFLSLAGLGCSGEDRGGPGASLSAGEAGGGETEANSTSTSTSTWDDSDGTEADPSAGSDGDCVPQCGERVCGVDPICGVSCGACGEWESCDAAGACVEPEPGCKANLFVDSFESADMSASNSDGFSWSNNNRTSIVTMSPGPMAVWNNGPIADPGPDGADWTAKHGEHSLRFRYPAGEYWSEQRFNMGAPYPEIWIRYWLRVPTNFRHGHSSPTNNKFFALWMDGYSQQGDGATVFWNFWRQGETDSSRFTFSVTESGSPSGGHHSGYPDFIRSPEDQGRWMQVVLYAKMATDADSMDGEARIYRRWEDEDAFTLIGETTGKNLSAPPGGPNGWQRGYIMGWANPAYDEDTEWLLDRFEVSTEPLDCL